jgi:hypothetical protein
MKPSLISDDFITAHKFWRLIENRDPKQLKLKLAPRFYAFKSIRWYL